MIRSGYDIHRALDGHFYQLLETVPAGLLLDIGAAAGFESRAMLDVNPACQVIAFEPFPGNTAYFDDVISGLWHARTGRGEQADYSLQVKLIEAAVCEHCNGVAFDVPTTVKPGASGRWADLPGYSSVGRIGGGDATTPSTTLDAALPTQTVRFAKLDVQRAEAAVLRGAKSMITEGRLEALCMEYSGDGETLELLAEYEIYDSPYLIIPRDGQRDLSEWSIVQETSLSTGMKALRGWPKLADRSRHSEFLAEQRRKIGNIETDLLCVLPGRPVADAVSSLNTVRVV